jgi:hypothetical protein
MRQDDDIFKSPESTRVAAIAAIEKIVESSGGYKQLLIQLEYEKNQFGWEAQKGQ